MSFQTHDATKFIRDYIIKERIGVGSYGMIYKVMNKNTKQFFVLKQIPFISSENKTEIEEVKNEALILSQLNSRFVVRYYDSFEENNCLNIVMEYCEGGDLCSYLETMHKYTKKLNESQIWKFFIQLSLGIDYIHKRKILHRDLKTMNIFLTKNLDIKIGDLGVAKRLLNTANAYTFIGTPFYLSPEICEEKPYNEKSDVWALGCILYEMMTFKHPFNATNQAALFIKILNGSYEPVIGKYSKELKKMIDILLEKDHLKRPSIRKVIEMPSFLSKAKSLGMIEYVIDALSFFNSNGNDAKVKMIKIAAVHVNKNKNKDKIIKSSSRKKKRRENSIDGIGGVNENGVINENNSQHSDINSSHNNNQSNNNSKGVKKLPIQKKLSLNDIEHHHYVCLNKHTPKKKKLVLPMSNYCNNNSERNSSSNCNSHSNYQFHQYNQNNLNNNNKEQQQPQVKNNPIQLKKPMVSLLNCDNNIRRKLNQISNDYNRQKVKENNLLFSESKKDKNKKSKETIDISLKDNDNPHDKKLKASLLKEKQISPSISINQKLAEETKESINIGINFKLRNVDIKRNIRKKKVLHMNSFNSHSGNKGSSSNKDNSSTNLSKDHYYPNPYPPINKVKSSKEQLCDMYQFAKELDKKSLKIQTIKKSKTNERMSHVPLCHNKTDEYSFKVEEAQQSLQFDNNLIECMTDHNSQSNWNANKYGNNNHDNIDKNNMISFYEEEEDDEDEEDETVSIIINNDLIEKEKREIEMEYNERKQSQEKLKKKVILYKDAIMKYSNVIDCDYFFNLHKELENNENIDEKMNKIIEYIHKTIPEKEEEVKQSYHNFVIYEIKNKENEKAIKCYEQFNK